MAHVVVLLQRIRAGAVVSHRVMPTPACPERDASGIIAFPMTRSTKQTTVSTTGFIAMRATQQNKNGSRIPNFVK